MPDQKEVTITNELIKVLSRLGIPEILHSDQGRNFESTVLAQTLNAFGLSKSRTTAYHPECDGMVEWFNRPLLQLLHSYVDTEENWEKYLPLVLYGYCTSVHFSTGVSPFMMMYGRQPKQSDLSNPTAFDSQSYPEHVYGHIRGDSKSCVQTNHKMPQYARSVLVAL